MRSLATLAAAAAALSLASASASTSHSSSAKSQPNIVLLITDDQVGWLSVCTYKVYATA